MTGDCKLLFIVLLLDYLEYHGKLLKLFNLFLKRPIKNYKVFYELLGRLYLSRIY